MRTRLRRWLPSWRTPVLAGVVALSITSCRSKMDPAVVGHGLPDTSSSRKAPERLLPRCDANEVIQYPDSDAPEWVVGELFGAALSAKPEAKAFKRFAPLFAKVHRREWVREAYWTAARKHVRTYVTEDSDEDEVVFTICRRVKETGNKLKLFIGSNDPQRSNIPITLAQDEAGAWKVVAYAP
jgi:hypothetical protein